MRWLVGLMLLTASCTAHSTFLKPPDTRAKAFTESLKLNEISQPTIAPAWYRCGAKEGNSPYSVWEPLSLSAVGENQALVLTTLGFVAVDKTSGLLGQLDALLPTDKAKLGGGDQVFVMRAQGQLIRYPGTSELLQQETSSGRSIGYWHQWRAFDASPGCVAIAKDDEVSISLDDGISFHRSIPESNRHVNNLWCRSDGLVVAEIPDRERVEFYSTRDRGRRWSQLPNGPPSLFRDGTFLWGKKERCIYVVSENGTSWIETDERHLPRRDFWLRFVSLNQSPKHVGPSDFYDAARPSMVSDRTLGSTPCAQSSDQTSPSYSLSSPSGGNNADCSGQGCLRYIHPKKPSGLTYVGALAATSDKRRDPLIVVANTDQGAHVKTAFFLPARISRPRTGHHGAGLQELGQHKPVHIRHGS